MLRPHALPILLLACVLWAPAAHSRALKTTTAAIHPASGPVATAAAAPAADKPLPAVPERTVAGAATLTASKVCMDAWLKATAQETVAAACGVLKAMDPMCVAELQLQALLEEAIAGAAGLTAY